MQLIIRRGESKRRDWKALIVALVLVGYEVYADDERIVFKLGGGDKVTDE